MFIGQICNLVIPPKFLTLLCYKCSNRGNSLQDATVKVLLRALCPRFCEKPTPEDGAFRLFDGFGQIIPNIFTYIWLKFRLNVPESSRVWNLSPLATKNRPGGWNLTPLEGVGIGKYSNIPYMEHLGKYHHKLHNKWVKKWVNKWVNIQVP